MEMALPEIVDRIVILKLKLDKNNLPELRNELNYFEKGLKEFEKRGVEINPELINQLFEINKSQWDLMSEANNIKNDKNNLKRIGEIYIELVKLNEKRIEVKNQIL